MFLRGRVGVTSAEYLVIGGVLADALTKQSLGLGVGDRRDCTGET